MINQFVSRTFASGPGPAPRDDIPAWDSLYKQERDANAEAPHVPVLQGVRVPELGGHECSRGYLTVIVPATLLYIWPSATPIGRHPVGHYPAAACLATE